MVKETAKMVFLYNPLNGKIGPGKNCPRVPV